MKYFVGWFLAFGISTNTVAQNAPSKFFPVFAAYEREVQLYESGQSKLTLEQLYNKSNAIESHWAKALENVHRANTSKAGLLNDERYEQQVKPYHDLAAKRSDRFVLAHEEVVIARPVLLFYSKLAGQRGNLADQSFFNLMSGLYQDIKVWPNYMTQMTDYSGCTNFGNGELSKQYGAWTSYRSQFPNAYKDDAQETLLKIEDELSTGTCACGDQQSFQSELKLFIKTYPQSKLTPLLAHRLASPKHAPPKGLVIPMRFNCSPG